MIGAKKEGSTDVCRWTGVTRKKNRSRTFPPLYVEKKVEVGERKRTEAFGRRGWLQER